VHRVGPPRKSYSGAGGPQGTAGPRGQSPEAERLVSNTVATACRDNRELKHPRRRSEPNGTWARGVVTRHSPADQIKAAKGRANPRSVGGRATNALAQVARTSQRARYAAEKRNRRRMTRQAAPASRKKRTAGARRRENRKGAGPAGGCRQGRKRRSGIVAGLATPATARRDR